MAKKCFICTHKNRCQIDEAILKKTPYSTIAHQFKIGGKDPVTTIKNHVRYKHISVVLRAAAEENERAGLAKVGNIVQDRIDEIYKTAFELVEMAKSNKDPKSAAYCLSQAIAVTNLLHESSGMEKLQEEIDSLKDLLKDQ